MHLLRSVVPLVILPFLLQGHAYPQRAGHLTEIRSEALEGREADTEWNGKLVGCNPEEEDAVRIAVAGMLNDFSTKSSSPSSQNPFIFQLHLDIF